MRIKVVSILSLLTIILLVTSCGYPKMAEVISVDAVLTSITYTTDAEHSTLFVDSPIFNTGLNQRSPIRSTATQIAPLVVARPYHFVIETWTNGWGPFYILRETAPLLPSTEEEMNK